MMKSFKEYKATRDFQQEWHDNLRFAKRIYKDYLVDKVNPFERLEDHNLIVGAFRALNHPKINHHLKRVEEMRPNYQDLEVAQLGPPSAIMMDNEGIMLHPSTEHQDAQGQLERKARRYYYRMRDLGDWLSSRSLEPTPAIST